MHLVEESPTVGGGIVPSRKCSIQPVKLMSGVPIWCAVSRAMATHNRSCAELRTVRYATNPTISTSPNVASSRVTMIAILTDTGSDP